MLLILFLNSTFKLYYLKDIAISAQIEINHVIYVKDDDSNKNQGFIGFFDWLRTDMYTICGIRVCYFDDLPYNNILRSYPYIQSAFSGSYPELLFKGNYYNPKFSGDQDFTNNYAYRSNTSDYLLTFGLDHLTEDELNSLLVYCEKPYM